ncbi:Rho termination factor, N-terminal domain [Fulvimarina manganoxydans]|uniref:Rho termination factor, N-terminal domain n=1 Tax=Fulvimarina manganoxydans TaxID=937218 RepID=A0A1W2CT78_9HYPH|nr:Rho termination factor N-terminal domain-containing protein [Fulvimarina manganoxydans]MEE2950810.1 Rho termination factor N-terminal domain-containing protein [Pseudomonadota bacterium]SMC88455.1 Rho termination factor, N-terminal domain [Fulvimarina manganoxydans]
MARKDNEDNPSLKNPDLYEDLRDQGYSKSKSAAISNAQANENMHPSKKGGKSPTYEKWTKDELYDRAQELDIEGRSGMTKDELIGALRKGQ